MTVIVLAEDVGRFPEFENDSSNIAGCHTMKTVFLHYRYHRGKTDSMQVSFPCFLHFSSSRSEGIMVAAFHFPVQIDSAVAGKVFGNNRTKVICQ